MNYSTKGLDQDLVKQSQQGKNWDKNDQARYDQAVKQRGQAKERAQGQQASRPQRPSGQQGQQQRPQGQQQGQPPRPKPPEGIPKPPQGNQEGQQQGKGFSNTFNPQQTQNVAQDNDIQSTVTGDKNYVQNTQDNSIRYYGGDNRSFVYNSKGEGPDTPATMATLAGYYAPDDSHGAQAARLDRNVTMNRDNQKKYANTSSIAEGAIARAERNQYIDPNALDKRIADRAQYHKDQSTIKGSEIFGDLFGMKAPTWNSAKPANPVEKPDFDKMYDKYTDF